MIKHVYASAVFAAFAAIGSSTAFATSAAPGHTQMGTPGDPNFRGQTIAHVTHAEGANGIGNLARSKGMTVQELHAEVNSYCSGQTDGGFFADLFGWNDDGVFPNARAFLDGLLR